ncbi:hypothetical protein QTH83_06775 [Streptococcus sp. VTCC 12813]|nr:hypothetical protein [Streptococcus sp. VTCC 12813]
MAKVKNKKKAFKHRLKKQGLFNNLKAPVPPVAPQAIAETQPVAEEEVVAKDLRSLFRTSRSGRPSFKPCRDSLQ